MQEMCVIVKNTGSVEFPYYEVFDAIDSTSSIACLTSLTALEKYLKWTNMGVIYFIDYVKSEFDNTYKLACHY